MTDQIFPVFLRANSGCLREASTLVTGDAVSAVEALDGVLGDCRE